MGRFARNTDVSVEKSRAEIETILKRYGASHFAYMTSPAAAIVAFQAKDRRIRFDLPLPSSDEKRFTHARRGRSQEPTLRPVDARMRDWERACRQSWRALCLVIKAKLEAVETGITTFENEFLAHIVMPDGITVGEHISGNIAAAYKSGKTPALLPPPRNS